MHKEQPDVVVCTGVLAMIPLCMEAKLSGRKLIYIESFAKVTSATLTGKLLYHYGGSFLCPMDTDEGNLSGCDLPGGNLLG